MAHSIFVREHRQYTLDIMVKNKHSKKTLIWIENVFPPNIRQGARVDITQVPIKLIITLMNQEGIYACVFGENMLTVEPKDATVNLTITEKGQSFTVTIGSEEAKMIAEELISFWTADEERMIP